MGATISATIEGQTDQDPITVLAPSSFGAGDKLVGKHIGAGRYRSNNPATGFCYWERLSGFGGTGFEIIVNGLGGGPAVVEISASDVGFGSDGCNTWIKVVGPITVSPTAPFGVGTFVVGIDVSTGTWQSNGTGTSCY